MANMHWPSTSTMTLIAYLLAVSVLGFVHSPWMLALALILALVAAGHARWQLLRRTLFAVLAFNLGITLGYALMMWWQGDFSWAVLVRMNLRVTLLVLLGFWFIHRVNLLRALGFSPALARLVAIASGQASVFARMAQDFRLALISRSAGMRLPWAQRLRHGAHLCTQLLDKSVASAEQTTRAMRARGCFDD